MPIVMTMFHTPESLGGVFLYIAGGALALAIIGLIVRLIRGRRKAVSGEEYLDLLYRQHTPFGQDFKQPQPPKNRRSRSVQRRPARTAEKPPEQATAPPRGDTALVTLDTWRRALSGGDNTLAAEIESQWKQAPMTVPIASLLSLACGDTKLIRKMAARVLADLDADASLPMMIAALETATAEEGEIIGSIMEIIDDPRAAEPLLKFTHRQAGEVFGGTAVAVSSGTSPNLEQARNWVRTSLKEKAYDWLNENFDTLDQDDPQVVAVIEALGELGDERAADMLLPLWRKSDGSFKEVVFDSLVKVAGPELSDKLLLEINSPAEPDSEPEDGLAALELLLASEDEFQRLEAVTSLDENAGPAVMPFLVRAAEDDSWTVRYAAVEALSHFLPESAEARAVLEKTCSDNSRKVRELAGKVLKEA